MTDAKLNLIVTYFYFDILKHLAHWHNQDMLLEADNRLSPKYYRQT